jgi:hypothetical protein
VLTHITQTSDVRCLVGENTLKVSHFSPKRWCITNIIISNTLKVWWYPLAILNTSKKNFKLCMTKLILIQHLNKDDWIKLMYIQYIIYNFSMAIGPHVYGSWNITKQKKIEKIMQCPCINFLFFDVVMVFPLKEILLCIYCSKMQKKTHIFWMKIYPTILNIQIVFKLIYVYQYHTL